MAKLTLNHNKIQAKQGVFNSDVTNDVLQSLKQIDTYKELTNDHSNVEGLCVKEASNSVDTMHSGFTFLSSEPHPHPRNFISRTRVNFKYRRAKKPTRISINTLINTINSQRNVTLPVHMPSIDMKVTCEFIQDENGTRTKLNELKIKQAFASSPNAIRFSVIENFYTRDSHGWLNSCYGDNLSQMNAFADPELFAQLLFSSLGNNDLSNEMERNHSMSREYFYRLGMQAQASQVTRNNENKAIIYSLYEKFKDHDEIVLKELQGYLDVKYDELVLSMKKLYDEGELDLYTLFDDLEIKDRLFRTGCVLTYENVLVVLQSLLYHLLPNSDQLVNLLDFNTSNND